MTGFLGRSRRNRVRERERYDAGTKVGRLGAGWVSGRCCRYREGQKLYSTFGVASCVLDGLIRLIKSISARNVARRAFTLERKGSAETGKPDANCQQISFKNPSLVSVCVYVWCVALACRRRRCRRECGNE